MNVDSETVITVLSATKIDKIRRGLFSSPAAISALRAPNPDGVARYTPRLTGTAIAPIGAELVRHRSITT
jgi:hypothetical protein